MGKKVNIKGKGDGLNILVTGGTGFIGSHLVKELTKEHETWVLMKPFEATQEFYLRMARDAGAKEIAGDLRDKFSLDNALRISNPHVIWHLGAETSVAQSYYNPVVFAETNFIGTINLVQSALKYAPRLERLFYIATTEALKSRLKPHSEFDYEYDANSSYGISKIAAELYSFHAYRAFGLPTTIIRFNNTIHRKTSRHYLIESVITQLLKGPKVVLKGSAKTKRTWTLIDDTVGGALACMKYSKEGELYHVVNPQNQATIREVIEIAADQVFNYDDVEIIEGAEPRPWDPLELCLTSERLDEIRWKPKHDLAHALSIVQGYWAERLRKTEVGSKSEEDV